MSGITSNDIFGKCLGLGKSLSCFAPHVLALNTPTCTLRGIHPYGTSISGSLIKIAIVSEAFDFQLAI